MFRTVIIILDLEVVKSANQMPGKIGDPTPYVEGTNSLVEMLNDPNKKSCYTLQLANSVSQSFLLLVVLFLKVNQRLHSLQHKFLPHVHFSPRTSEALVDLINLLWCYFILVYKCSMLCCVMQFSGIQVILLASNRLVIHSFVQQMAKFATQYSWVTTTHLKYCNFITLIFYLRDFCGGHICQTPSLLSIVCGVMQELIFNSQ